MKQELKLLSNGDLSSLNEVALISGTIEEVKQPLRYAMMMAGLREHNLPSDEEKNVLINFVIDNYPDYTPMEIKFAFEKALARKFPIDNPSCFENFSCEYVGRILHAYEQWDGYEEPDAIMRTTLDFWRETFQNALKSFIAGTKPDLINPKMIYNLLLRDGHFLAVNPRSNKIRYFQAKVKIAKFFIHLKEKGISELYVQAMNQAGDDYSMDLTPSEIKARKILNGEKV